MSKTSVTTFQKAVIGDLEFPLITDFGIIKNPDLVVYLESMTAAGHTLTSNQKNALVSFMEDIEDFQSKIIEIYPIFGDENACALIPLFAKLTDNAILEGDIGYEEVSEKTVGIKPLATGDKIAYTPLTIKKLYDKDSTFAYPGSKSSGVVLYRNNDLAVANAYGVYAKRDNAGSLADWIFYLRSTGSPYTTLQDRPFNSGVNNVASVGLDKFWHFCHNETAAKWHTGSLSSITEGTATLTSMSYDEATDFPYHPELLKIGITGQANYDEDGLASLGSFTNTSSQTRFYSQDDGTMTTAEMNAYRTAIAALISGLDKDF